MKQNSNKTFLLQKGKVFSKPDPCSRKNEIPFRGLGASGNCSIITLSRKQATASSW